MIDQEKLEATGNHVGMILSLAEDIDEEILAELIRMTGHPLAKIMMPMIAEQLKEQTGLKVIPITEMEGAMKLVAFFVAEYKKLGFKDKMMENQKGGAHGTGK